MARPASSYRRLAMNQDFEAMAHTLENTGAYRVLRRFQFSPRPGEPAGVAVILDTETTGLDPESAELIDFGALRVRYDAAGNILDVIEETAWLREPGEPIPPEVSRLTGITHDMVRGQGFTPRAVLGVCNGANLLIAHNVRYDRTVLARFAKRLAHFPWACSMSEIGWREIEGRDTRALGPLLQSYGYFHTGHRALNDAQATLAVLSQPSIADGRPLFAHLLASASRDTYRVFAWSTPYETRKSLKARGYSWEPGRRVWFKDTVDAVTERAWLASYIYPGGTAENAEVQPLTAVSRYAD